MENEGSSRIYKIIDEAVLCSDDPERVQGLLEAVLACSTSLGDSVDQLSGFVGVRDYKHDQEKRSQVETMFHKGIDHIHISLSPVFETYGLVEKIPALKAVFKQSATEFLDIGIPIHRDNVGDFFTEKAVPFFAQL